MRPQVIDSFMWNSEVEILQMRLETMAPAVDWFVLVEADVDHQNHPKPYHFAELAHHFEPWLDKIIAVQAKDLPTTPHEQDPWAREWAQRDWVWQGLERVPNLSDSDIVLHGDVDEICRPMQTRNVRPKYREFVAFGQTMYCFAVDWLHPEPWGGTVAVTVETARGIGERSDFNPGAWQIVRNQRNQLIEGNFVGLQLGSGWRRSMMWDAGWHFTWLGGRDAALRKLGSFCHPEIAIRTQKRLDTDSFMREGYHVDGTRLIAVEVDETWPAYVHERRCPEVWWRPR